MQRQVKNVMASVGCHGNSDVNKTWIITDFHIYTEQLWSHLNDIDHPDNSVQREGPRPTDVIVCPPNNPVQEYNVNLPK